jgi:cell division septal protein FtsQ
VKSLVHGLILALSCASLGALACGIVFAVHSPLFVVSAVEVSGAENQPVAELAAVPVGKISLFDVDLSQIENRVLADPWIRSVRIRKNFPETVAIEVELKTPRAIYQAASGNLSYVDSDGKPFGKVSLAELHDLPVLTGFENGPGDRIREALRLLVSWDAARTSRDYRLSSLAWDDERGYRGLMVYGLPGRRLGPGKARTMVDFGQDLDADPIPQLKRLNQVLRYLGENSIQARQIWADSGKKIVVKTAHGS